MRSSENAFRDALRYIGAASRRHALTVITAYKRKRFFTAISLTTQSAT
ncbi:hypothetical protein ALP44_101563 [Pseudomonas syringae pv. theae]|uniref:Uncharacterized protein n=1 Tax=Pseudomonas syringae pv. theae TaxID=103985 RepID=A0A3M5NL48_PSESX|nr:hypothetical protein ALP44_101563 [Pseudomonas syringae pv. theae]